MAFENLDIKKPEDYICFGRHPSDVGKSWVELANQSVTDGWSCIDVASLESDLARNTNDCYFNLASARVEDIDTGIVWQIKFDIDAGLWKIDIADSPAAKADEEQIKELVDSEWFTDFARETGDTIEDANRVYNAYVNSHLENGELLEVPEVKLGRILYAIDLKWLMDNLREKKYAL